MCIQMCQEKVQRIDWRREQDKSASACVVNVEESVRRHVKRYVGMLYVEKLYFTV